MILFAVADVHGRRENLERIKQVIWERKPDVLVAAGDVAHRRAPSPVLECLDNLSIPVLLVRGNMDPPGLDRLVGAYPNIRSLHRSEFLIRGIPFAGISGTIPVPFRTRISFREGGELADLRLRLHRESVLVAHPPPLGTLDRAFGLLPAGSRGLRDLVLQMEPRLFICGHIHEAAGMARLGRTLIVNAAMGRKGGGALIHLEPGGDPRVEWL